MTLWREATIADLEQIAALLRDDVLGATRESPDLSPYLAAFADMQQEKGNHMIVACDGDHIIGCYQLTITSGLSRAGMRRATIEDVRVHSSQRGAGLGAKLLLDAESRARAAGAALIQLTSTASRDDAQRFYTRAGYQPSHIGYKKAL